MKILLINDNPVVSRLTTLSARKENIEIDEIKEISELKQSDYTIVFIDSESYTKEISNAIGNSDIQKKVLFHAQDEDEYKKAFNQTILKPFLPSEVSEVLREMKIEIHNKESQATKSIDIEKEEYLDLSELIENKANDLESLDLESLDLMPKKTKNKPNLKEEMFDLDEFEEIKKEELRPLATEKKDNFDLKLEEIFPLKLDDELYSSDFSNKSEKINLDDDLFELDDRKEKRPFDEDLFDFDIESSQEVNLDNATTEKIVLEKTIEKKPIQEKPPIETKREDKIEAKILDTQELSNIKNLLDETVPTDNNLTLEDVMTTPAPMMSIQEETPTKEEPKKKVDEKPTAIATIEEQPQTSAPSGEVLASVLGTMPIDDLRRLLRGATVNITIEFPNEL